MEVVSLDIDENLLQFTLAEGTETTRRLQGSREAAQLLLQQALAWVAGILKVVHSVEMEMSQDVWARLGLANPRRMDRVRQRLFEVQEQHRKQQDATRRVASELMELVGAPEELRMLRADSILERIQRRRSKVCFTISQRLSAAFLSVSMHPPACIGSCFAV